MTVLTNSAFPSASWSNNPWPYCQLLHFSLKYLKLTHGTMSSNSLAPSTLGLDLDCFRLPVLLELILFLREKYLRDTLVELSRYERLGAKRWGEYYWNLTRVQGAEIHLSRWPPAPNLQDRTCRSVSSVFAYFGLFVHTKSVQWISFSAIVIVSKGHIVCDHFRGKWDSCMEMRTKK